MRVAAVETAAKLVKEEAPKWTAPAEEVEEAASWAAAVAAQTEAVRVS